MLSNLGNTNIVNVNVFPSGYQTYNLSKYSETLQLHNDSANYSNSIAYFRKG